MQRQNNNKDASKEKILKAIKKLNDANPQHRIAKKRLQAKLEALKTPPKQPRNRKKLTKEKESKSSLNEKTFQSDSDAQSSNIVGGEQRPQTRQNYGRNSMHLWTIEDTLKQAHRIIDRRQKFIKKQKAALEKDLQASKKAEEAITLLKQQIEYKYDMVSDGLMKLKQKQSGDIAAMKDQIKCISRQNEENVESEKIARDIVAEISQNQVTPISILIGDFAFYIVRLFLYSTAALRDFVFRRNNSSINVQK